MIAVRRAALIALVMSAAMLVSVERAQATIGLAEWEVATPGGNRIVHRDPYVERSGTCLLGGRGEEVHVTRIRWWQYYATYVLGETDSGFFLFDEVSRGVDWYTNVEAARTRARQRSGGPPNAAVLRGPAPPARRPALR